MIVVKLTGGIGNQLFQYSLGRHLAEINNTKLKIDISSYESYDLHGYELNKFNIQEQYPSNEELETINKFSNGIYERLKRKIFNFASQYSPPNIIEKDTFLFDPKILKMTGDIYLDGYWQSEKYFVGIEEIIRNELTIKLPQQDLNKEVSEMIGSSNSVSIHIRRGDYISNQETYKKHGVCEMSYYQECILRLCEKVNNPFFYLFSDDPEWVRENFYLDFPIKIIDFNSKDKSYEDLRLMSQCKHNIIANSSFSWWGAWLNNNKNKLVFAPKKWQVSGSNEFKDLVPKKWITI